MDACTSQKGPEVDVPSRNEKILPKCLNNDPEMYPKAAYHGLHCSSISSRKLVVHSCIHLTSFESKDLGSERSKIFLDTVLKSWSCQKKIKNKIKCCPSPSSGTEGSAHWRQTPIYTMKWRFTCPLIGESWPQVINKVVWCYLHKGINSATWYKIRKLTIIEDCYPLFTFLMYIKLYIW